MKRFQLLGVMLMAVFVVSVVAAGSASAEVTFLLAEWLKNGSAVVGELNTEAVGTMLLEDSKTPLGASNIVCSWVLLGRVGEDGLDVVSEVLNLARELISSTPLAGLSLECEEQAVCQGSLVWLESLPWQTLLELMEEGTESFFVDLLAEGTGGLPAWDVECTETILKPSDLCEGEVAIKLSLEGASLLLTEVNDAFGELAGVSLATCSLGGAGSGIRGSAPQQLSLENGEVLNASTESEEVVLLAEWLKNGSAVVGELNTEAVGTMLLEDSNTPLGASNIVCSWVLLGRVGEDGSDVVSEVLNLARESISTTPLAGLSLECEEQAVCKGSLVWLENLPWQTLLEQMEEGTEHFFVDLLAGGAGGLPAWDVECTETILKPSDLCEGEVAIKMSSEGASLLLTEVNDAFGELAGVSLATCSLGGPGSGIRESVPQPLSLENGEVLNASTESEEKHEEKGFLLAEWLKNGAAIAGELNTETVGTILLEDTNTPLGASKIICSGALLGRVGEDGLGVVSEVLNLNLESISSTPLTGLSLECEEEKVCAGSLLWPENLPWQTLLELMEDGTEIFFVNLLEGGTGGLPAWDVECTETILKPSDLCEGQAAIKLSLEAGSLLLGEFSDAFNELAEVPLGTCTLGGTGTVIAGTIPTQLVLTNGETLNASSEAVEA